MIIDFHTHIFPDVIVEKALNNLSKAISFVPFFDGTDIGILKDMERTGVNYSIILPVATKPEQVEIVNDQTIFMNKREKKIIFFGTMHPDYIDYKKELKRLKDNGVKGIKLHPVFQLKDMDSDSYVDVVNEAFKLGLIVVFHAGLDPGFPERLYSSYKKILSFIDKIDLSKGNLVLAHMGSLDEFNESYEYILGKNLYIDTAMSFGTINHMEKGLVDITDRDLIIKMIKKHGSEKILFGSDNPWMDAKSMVDVLNSFPLTKEEKDNILFKNACKLLSIKEE